MYELAVTFSNPSEDISLKFVVIAGGHIEPGEDSLTAAKRELYEETGAAGFVIFPVSIYNVVHSNAVSSGMVYFAHVTELGDLPREYEMAERIFSDTLPDNLTYPLIQPKLFERVNAWLDQNLTVVYFIRHAKPDRSLGDERTYPLTASGTSASEKLAKNFSGIRIDRVFSSPYKRALDTVLPLAQSKKLEAVTVEDFRERKIADTWIDDFISFSKKQWEDFEYKLNDGECLREVRERNISALEKILAGEKGTTIAIGTHGTALSTIVNHYVPSFGHGDFMKLAPVMPYILKMEFLNLSLLRMEVVGEGI